MLAVCGDTNRSEHHDDTIENKLFHTLYMEMLGTDGEFIRQWTDAEGGNNNVINANSDNGTYSFLQYR